MTMLRVSAVTPSRFFAGSTLNVPSAFGNFEGALIEQEIQLNGLTTQQYERVKNTQT